MAKNEEGQAVIEFIVVLLMAISVVGLMAAQFQRPMRTLWQTFGCEIAAACPSCPPPGDVANKLQPGACRR